MQEPASCHMGRSQCHTMRVCLCGFIYFNSDRSLFPHKTKHKNEPTFFHVDNRHAGSFSPVLLHSLLLSTKSPHPCRAIHISYWFRYIHTYIKADRRCWAWFLFPSNQLRSEIVGDVRTVLSMPRPRSQAGCALVPAFWFARSAAGAEVFPLTRLPRPHPSPCAASSCRVIGTRHLHLPT